MNNKWQKCTSTAFQQRLVERKNYDEAEKLLRIDISS
jgi:hypothetical protein